ncbi:TIGR00645 family protein [Methylocapsa acidiphila]|uniref:TIGR00645 family protein n=1 Tax=Methylocapsa acidiphila TaxID=133552 RepID=UPI0004060BF9|nr:TIGR00645 family protein [Methylocapsa acidiphila]
MLKRGLEVFLFASRWLLLPFYLTLVLGLAALLVKMGQLIYELLPHLWESQEADVLLQVLGLVDLTFASSLIVLVIFSGYANFISRLTPGATQSWPEWLAQIDFTGVKLKLMSSIVAISAIQLLRAFMDVKNTPDRELYWYAGCHLVFVFSALVLAITDRISGDKR